MNFLLLQAHFDFWPEIKFAFPFIKTKKEIQCTTDTTQNQYAQKS